jgi:hypothetical protein
MQYKVTSLHYMPDGVTPFQGSYNLVMRSSAARCLYKFSSAPVQAVVEVINPNGTNQIAATTLTESDGWLRLSASGFTFSSPTLKFKLTQSEVLASQSPTPTPTPKPDPSVSPVSSPTPSASPSASSIQAESKSTIVCIKGKVTKKLTAVAPKCPTGYKKKG